MFVRYITNIRKFSSFRHAPLIIKYDIGAHSAKYTLNKQLVTAADYKRCRYAPFAVNVKDHVNGGPDYSVKLDCGMIVKLSKYWGQRERFYVRWLGDPSVEISDPQYQYIIWNTKSDKLMIDVDKIATLDYVLQEIHRLFRDYKSDSKFCEACLISFPEMFERKSFV